MKNFEYKTAFLELKLSLFPKNSEKKIQDFLNSYGKEGWELIQIFEKTDILASRRLIEFFFKREIE